MNTHRTYPLSPAQERLVFVHEVSGSDDAYLFPLNLRFRGHLEVGHLETALRDVVERHEVLRSRVTTDGESLRQTVMPEFDGLTFTDLSHHPHPRAQELAEEAAANEATTAFDLRAGWTRFQLLRLSSEDHVLLVSVHHVAFDGWSCQIFLREIAHAYNAHVGGQRPTFPELGATYGDIARWERERLTEGVDVAARDFWTEQTTDLPDDLPLPTDLPRPDIPSGRTARVWWHLGAEETTKVETAAREYRVTLYMLLLAAFEATVARAAGSHDFFIGGATAGRHHPDSGDVIGLFVNEVAYRSDVAPDQTFAELVTAVKKRALRVYQHQNHPFEQVVSIAKPPRRTDRHPLFQHAVSLQPREGDEVAVSFEGVEVEGFTTQPEGSALDLTFSFHYEDDGLHLAVDFATDLWHEPTIANLTDNFRTVLHALCTDPAARLDDLDLVTLHRIEHEPTLIRSPATPQVLTGTAESQVTEIMRVFADLLGSDVSVDTDFFDAGGDSLLAMRAVTRLRSAGVTVAIRDLLNNPTPRRLALSSAERSTTAERPAAVGHVRPDGLMPALPMQAWFEHSRPWPKFYNFSALLRHEPQLDARLFSRAVGVVLKRHDATRMRFSDSGGRLEVRHIPGAGHQRLEVVDLSGHDPHEALKQLHRHTAEVQASLTVLGTDPLVRTVLYQCPDGASRVLIAACHLVMDVVSMHVVIDDIREAYAALVERRPIELPELTVSAHTWSEELRRRAAEPASDARAAGWAVVEECAPSDLPVDHPEAPNLVADEHTTFHRLSPEETSAVGDFVARTPGVTHESLILAAIGVALGDRIGDRGIIIDLEHHGRNGEHLDLDVSRTVGWFTSIFPFPLLTGDAAEGRRGLMRVTRDLLTGRDEWGEYAALAASGRGEFVDRSVAFSHAGAGSPPVESAWRFENLGAQDARHPEMRRRHALEVDSQIAEKILRVGLTYSRSQFDRSSIDGLGRKILDAILDAAEVQRPNPGTAVISRVGERALWPADRPVPDGWSVAAQEPTVAAAEQWIGSRVTDRELATRLEKLHDVEKVSVFRGRVTVALTPDAVHRFSAGEDTLEGWDIVFSDLYEDTEDETVGWVDFVTGRPHDVAAMRDWVDATGRRLESLPRRRVFEIGCGTGMIARRVLASGGTDEYTATDLTDVACQAETWPSHGATVRTIQAPAHEAVGHAESTDLTILHSVVQYFPSTEYTADVLAAAVAATAPGGHVYIGDVRHHGFDDLLLRRRRLAAPGEAHVGDESSVELGLAPAWFEALAARLPTVSRVDVVPRLGSVDTEMTRYRFDVLLHVGCGSDVGLPPPREVSEIDTATWTSMLEEGREFRLLLPNGWHHEHGLTPEELTAAAKDRQGSLSLRPSDDGPDAFLDAWWTPSQRTPCAWGHQRLHEEWRATPALAPRIHGQARAELLHAVGVAADDLDPAVTVTLTDLRGHR
ncbi:MAG TPA: methyltransferase domain-containing protein [Candidatus Stackebrandtia excrementipullorum]|nr:methyltransferase domain-containing protein [Candidatus Stackebrandtia excrementipullorum]